jgi:hypothetical protein
VNEESLLGPVVPDGYTELCLVGELNLVGILLSLVDSFLDLIHRKYIGDGRLLLAVPLLAFLILQAFGDCFACTHFL